MDSDFEPLSPAQARVLGVLVEKQHTVPDSYPLSLNALVAGCNQKTARQPVMELDEPTVLQALDELKRRHLVVEVSGSRVLRFDHNMARGLGVPGQAVALLAMLMLRGPQTSAELRLHCERLHRFADISSVEAFLDELASKTPPLALKLARAPGEREARWAHLLCGEPVQPSQERTQAAMPVAGAVLDELRAELNRQAAELAALRTELAQLRAQLKNELGLNAPTPETPDAI